MIGLDTADLIVIASEVLGCDTGTALAQADITAAGDALAQAGMAGKARSSGGARPDPGDAGEAAVALMGALLRHPPFPAHRGQIAVAAGLQFLAVNGWQAYLDVPRAAVIVIERLASGQLTPAQAASWLTVRLYPDPGLAAGEGHQQAMPASRSAVAQIARAVRQRYHRRRHPSPFIVRIGGGDVPGGIITPVTGLMPFTGHATKTLLLAREEASRLGRPRGPEHILLGVVRADDGVAVKALQRLGVSPEAVREEAEQVTDEEPQQQPGFPPHIFLQTRRVWQAMADEAFAHGDDYIGTEHFLLALFCDNDNAAAQVLTRLGAGESAVRTAVAELVAESGQERSA